MRYHPPTGLLELELALNRLPHGEANPDLPKRFLLPGQVVVMICGFEHVEDARSLEPERAALLLEVTADCAGDGVLVHLADVVENAATLGAPVVPFLEELPHSHPVGAETSARFEAAEYDRGVTLPAMRRQGQAELVPRIMTAAKR